MWPWKKEFWDMPIRNLGIWGGIGMLFYATFLLGERYGRTDQPISELILQGLRTPLGCGSTPGLGGNAATPTVEYYTILMGSFARPEAASNLRTRLAADRINSHVLSQDGAYYVLVGRFTSAGQAEAMLAKIREKGYNQGRLIRPLPPKV